MPKKKGLDTAAVRALLQAEKASSLAAINASTLVKERSTALSYYNGKMDSDMPVEEGRSKAVSLDVADTVEGLMPQLLEIFAGSEEVVRFDPVGPEDVEPAQQETDYVNHVFMQQNPGFLILYTFIKDALLEKVGIVKIWCEETEDQKQENYYGLTEDQFAALASDQNIEITAHTATPDGFHDVECVTKKKQVKHIVENIPPEQFGITRSAKSIKTANYVYHESMKSESDLIKMGFDETQVKSLPTWVLTAWSTGVEAIARDTVNESTASGGDPGTNDATRQVKVTEHYVMMDYDGTGARRYRVTTGGDQGEVLKRNGKLDIEPVEDNPFAAASPIIMPHRFFGKSIADLVVDIQRIKTALMRGMLDNLYLHNNPRVEVAEDYAGESTLDDLLVSRPGNVVRTRKPGGLNWQEVPDITTSVYPALEYMDSVREWRTGVSKQAVGIDANALQNVSATASNQAYTASQARMKLIARVFAETGIRDMFSLLHGSIRRYGSAQETVRLRNKWVSVNPREWRERNDMTIHVGLGTGSKPERINSLMILANVQKELVAAGKTNLVDDAKLFNTTKELTKLLEYKDPTQFINDPSEKDQMGNPVHPPPPPPPSPEEIKGKVQLQIAQQQAQLDASADERKAQIEAVQAKADIETQNRKTEAEMVQSQQDFALKKELAILDFQLQKELKMQELAMKQEMHRQTLEHNEQMHKHQMAQGQMGMIATAQKHDAQMEAMKNKPNGAGK